MYNEEQRREGGEKEARKCYHCGKESTNWFLFSIKSSDATIPSEQMFILCFFCAVKFWAACEPYYWKMFEEEYEREEGEGEGEEMKK